MIQKTSQFPSIRKASLKKFLLTGSYRGGSSAVNVTSARGSGDKLGASTSSLCLSMTRKLGRLPNTCASQGHRFLCVPLVLLPKTRKLGWEWLGGGPHTRTNPTTSHQAFKSSRGRRLLGRAGGTTTSALLWNERTTIWLAQVYALLHARGFPTHFSPQLSASKTLALTSLRR